MLFHDYLAGKFGFFCLSFCIFAENCIFENPTMLDGYNPELKCQEIG